jgi:hypothetical protein
VASTHAKRSGDPLTQLYNVDYIFPEPLFALPLSASGLFQTELNFFDRRREYKSFNQLKVKTKSSTHQRSLMFMFMLDWPGHSLLS